MEFKIFQCIFFTFLFYQALKCYLCHQCYFFIWKANVQFFFFKSFSTIFTQSPFWGLNFCAVKTCFTREVSCWLRMYFRKLSLLDWIINLNGCHPSSKYIKWMGVFEGQPRTLRMRFSSSFSKRFICFKVTPYQASQLKIMLLTKQLFLNKAPISKWSFPAIISTRSAFMF